MSDSTARRVAADLVERLTDTGHRLVLAESCTCGMAAALMGAVPGASQVFCGSAVTYREATKSNWLDVPASLFQQHTAESLACTRALANGVLAHTPEATIAAAITGHLGPGAPPQTDGLVYVGVLIDVATPTTGGPTVAAQPVWQEWEIQLVQSDRGPRQQEAAVALLRAILENLPAHQGSC